MNTQQLKQALRISDETAAKWIEPLNAAMEKFGINTPARKSAFLAQIAHESQGLKALTENLKYSAEGLLKTFKKYFKTDSDAQSLARNEEKIANRVYAGRMGNGNEQSGDGWKFRGRGLIQLTGKENYQKCGTALGVDLVNNPDLVSTPQYAALSAAWFWSVNGINELADKGDLLAMTKRINGGTIGLEERKKLYDTASSVLIG